MTNEDWLRTQLLKIAPEDNSRMREACNIKPPYKRPSRANGSKSSKSNQDTTYRDYFLSRRTPHA